MGCEDALCERLRAEFLPLLGASVPQVVEHGDFWAGNIAATSDQMRVYDWEWTVLDGRPFFDLWTYRSPSCVTRTVPEVPTAYSGWKSA